MESISAEEMDFLIFKYMIKNNVNKRKAKEIVLEHGFSTRNLTTKK